MSSSKTIDPLIYSIGCNNHEEYNSVRDSLITKHFERRGTISKNRDLSDLAVREAVEIAILPHFDNGSKVPSETEVDFFIRPYNK